MASILLDSIDFKTYLDRIGPGRGRPERPDRCPFCSCRSVWFDGWRIVFCVVLCDGTPHHFDDGLPLQRVVCSNCHAAWTLRPGFLYPCLSFQLDVVEAAARAYLVDPEASYDEVAARFHCSPRSVWRWVGWLASSVLLSSFNEALKARGLSVEMLPCELPRRPGKARSTARAGTLLAASQVLGFLAMEGGAPTASDSAPRLLRQMLTGSLVAVPSSSPRSPSASTGPPLVLEGA